MGSGPSSPALSNASSSRSGRSSRRRHERPVPPGISLIMYLSRLVPSYSEEDYITDVGSDARLESSWVFVRDGEETTVDSTGDSAGDSCDSDEDHGPLDPPDDIPDAATMQDWSTLARENADLVESLLNCTICMETYKDPRLLQCGHTFCFRCLHTMWTKRRMRPYIRCPNCRKVTQIPEGDIEQLVTDFRVSQSLDVLRGLLGNVVHFNHKRKRCCVPCMSSGVSNKGQYYCLDCAMHLCHDCKADHDDCEDFKDHALQEVANEQFCDQHDAVCTYQCLDCSKSVCSVCVLGSCRRHTKHKLCANVLHARTGDSRRSRRTSRSDYPGEGRRSRKSSRNSNPTDGCRSRRSSKTNCSEEGRRSRRASQVDYPAEEYRSRRTGCIDHPYMDSSPDYIQTDYLEDGQSSRRNDHSRRDNQMVH